MERLSEKNVTTRKDHTCFGCLNVYPKGTKMNRQTCAGGGDIWTVYACEHCQELMPYYDCFSDEGYPEGFANDIKSEDEFAGSMPEYIEYVKKNYKSIAEYNTHPRPAKEPG